MSRKNSAKTEETFFAASESRDEGLQEKYLVVFVCTYDVQRQTLGVILSLDGLRPFLLAAHRGIYDMP